MNPIPIAIVEDDPLYRQTLRHILGRSGTYQCTAAYPSAEDALAAISSAKKAPAVVLMDINLPEMSGIACTARLKTLVPAPQVLMLTVYEDTERIFSALKAGASGYLLKRSTPAEILEALEDVLQGGSPMTSQIARKVVQSFRASPDNAGDATLTAREEEILKLASQGYVPKEIAAHLTISLHTARTHLKNIYEKLHVRSRTEAVIKYLK